jgi:ribosomal protein S18 acetylase RimI-like enzyme
MVSIRPSRRDDLGFVTALERHADNRELIGQWSDEEHLAAIDRRERWRHWIIEREGAPAGFMISRDCRSMQAGVYVKRILVGSRDRGTGQAALAALLAELRLLYGSEDVWLIVRNGNDRAQAVYRKHGFERFEPGEEEARRLDAVAEAPADKAFRMRRKA